jgi:hypothetical protein
MTLGMTAAPIGRGATEVGVFTGLQYAGQTNPLLRTTDGTGDPTAERTNGFSLPAFEANVQHGFDETFALNIHASSAGIQPGLKWNINKSKVAQVALLPAVAFGYASLDGITLTADSEGVLQENSPRRQTSLTLLTGLKVLLAHRSGFFAGVGYDFLFNRNLNVTVSGSGGSTVQQVAFQTLSHQVSASVGVDVVLGMVRIRPELAFAVYPGSSQNVVSSPPNESTRNGNAGFGFAIFPGLSVAVVSPPRELTEEEKEEAEAQKEREAQIRRQNGVPDPEEQVDDEDLGSEDRTPAVKKKRRRLIDDEEDEPPRSRRRPVNVEED